jgi:hypothetical protein
MTPHGALSILVKIKPAMKQVLANTLQEIVNQGVETNELIPFGKITSIHFARFVILQESIDVNGKPIDAHLVFDTSYDLPLQDHLEQLVRYGRKGLEKIFSCCENFTEVTTDNRLVAYLRSKMIRTETFYVGVGNRSVMEIRRENELRESIEKFLDTNYKLLKDKDAVFVRKSIIEYVNNTTELNWAKQPEPKAPVNWKFKFYAKIILAALLVLLLLPVVAVFLLIWFLLVLVLEIKDGNGTNVIDKNKIRELVNHETGIVQAQFSAVGNLKPGFIRRNTMIFLLRLVNFLAPYIFSKGKLSGIPTVHFARWLIIHEGRQMVFLSNFDGNSESYLRDFINIAAKQLTLLFSHTCGYPNTRLMFFGGAKDAKRFMEWARAKQTITNVWYSANKSLTVKNIYNNAAIRAGLYGNLSETEIRNWLKRF